ncbi:hypothetical protein JCM14469_05560 [Desulfatiferula olefinivorans]
MNRLSTWILTAFFLSILPSGAAAAGDDGLSIRVRPYSRVEGRTVYLKDIAELSGPAPMMERLEDLEITTAPHPGRKRRFPGSMVGSALRSETLKAVNLVVPDYVLVERDSQEVSEADLKKMFFGVIEKKSGDRAFRIRDVSIKGNRLLAKGPVTYRIDDRNLRTIRGRVTITVLARVPSERTRKLYVSGWVDVFDQVVCATRDIGRGEVIAGEDLVLEKMNLARAPRDLVFDPETVKGTQARTPIGKGKYVRESMIEAVPLVRKGDVVKIIARSGLLTVVTTGVSREDGGMGDQIEVENPESNKTMAARVVDRLTVNVIF